ncbi:hypothetical protein [Nonomuraea sp. LPB2021202275-12-8]|uniref:hypothetical protein n=1 Tax=Nonomuraea sp. LPB2021202275-12-8 TaxID=3120159 RepID=UPI00300C1D81
MMVITACSSDGAADQPAKQAQPSASATSAALATRLRAALLPAPKGMRVAYGPEVGAFGTLDSIKQGLEAIRQTKLERPECAGATELDPAKPEVASAPAAVIAFASARGSISQAVVALPPAEFPGPLPGQCAAYKAVIKGTEVTYRTRDLAMPRQGDESRAYLTTASGADQNAQIGSVVIRRGNVVMSLMVVGQEVKRAGLLELGRLADQNLSRVAT